MLWLEWVPWLEGVGKQTDKTERVVDSVWWDETTQSVDEEEREECVGVILMESAECGSLTLANQ